MLNEALDFKAESDALLMKDWTIPLSMRRRSLRAGR